MFFNKVLGIEKVDRENVKVNHREAVRAVILSDDKLLMVLTNKGDYKFPGGGVKSEEKHEEAIIREVREETGYIINAVKENIGVFTERSMDEFHEGAIFEMTSYYYICEVSEKQVLQQLDDYEAELDFCPRWISIEEAICNNERIIKTRSNDMNRWVNRETSVLNELKVIHR